MMTLERSELQQAGAEARVRERVERLQRLDTCAVSDALDKLGLSGAVTGLSRESGSGRVTGRIITVKLGVGEPPPGPPRHLCCDAVDQSGPYDVIVVEQRTGINAASFGGLLALGAKLRGVRGIIADGPVRDIDEARALGLGIFCRGVTCLTARGRLVEKGTNLPIDVGAVRVEPGDYAIADCSAVVIIAAAEIDRVIATAEELVAKEALLAKSILRGAPLRDVMAGSYENLLKGRQT